MKGGYNIGALKTWQSEEGGGYQGNLLKEGKKIGFFHQGGYGGPTEIRFEKEDDEKEFKAFIGALPTRTYPEEWGGGEYQVNGDIFVADLVNDFENEKRLKRHCKTKTLFRVEGDPEGEYRTLACAYGQKAQEYLDKKYGNKVVEVVNKRFL